MDPFSAISQHVASKREALASARRETEKLETELAALEEVLMIVAKAAAADVGQGMEASSHKPVSAMPSGVGAPSQQCRAPRGHWRRAMIEVASQFDDEFNLDDLKRVYRTLGVPVRRTSLRTQAANYTNNGWLERVSQGRFRFTQKGRMAVAHIKLKSDVSAPDKEKPDAGDTQASGLSSEAQTPPEVSNDFTLQPGEDGPR